MIDVVTSKAFGAVTLPPSYEKSNPKERITNLSKKLHGRSGQNAI